MKHLVLGGTGTVGSLVVKGLLGKGETVRVLTRSAEKAKSLPKGAVPVVGDLSDPDTYGKVFSDYDSLFLLNATGPAELQEGLAAVNEAARTGAKRVVYFSIHDVERAPAKATPAQLAETEAILGRKPRRFRDFVQETAAAWA